MPPSSELPRRTPITTPSEPQEVSMASLVETYDRSAQTADLPDTPLRKLVADARLDTLDALANGQMPNSFVNAHQYYLSRGGDPVEIAGWLQVASKARFKSIASTMPAGIRRSLAFDRNRVPLKNVTYVGRAAVIAVGSAPVTARGRATVQMGERVIRTAGDPPTATRSLSQSTPISPLENKSTINRPIDNRPEVKRHAHPSRIRRMGQALIGLLDKRTN